MPEREKLEDYANMNNTGFAFIDLNEELKENLKAEFNSEYFVVNYLNDEKEDLSIDFTHQESNLQDELKNFHKKIKEIYESKKPLILKIKIDVVGVSDKNHIFYDTIVKDCSISITDGYVYQLIMVMGSNYSHNNTNYVAGNYNVIRMSIKYYDSYVFSFSIVHKG